MSYPCVVSNLAGICLGNIPEDLADAIREARKRGLRVTLRHAEPPAVTVADPRGPTKLPRDQCMVCGCRDTMGRWPVETEPCPFCDSDHLELVHVPADKLSEVVTDDPYVYRVFCTACGGSGPPMRIEADAIWAWANEGER